MSELRWHPLLEQWVATATHRMHRPVLRKDFCPFCVGAEETPEPYERLALSNRFPTFSVTPPKPDLKGDALYKVKPIKGDVEVILYSPVHESSLVQLSTHEISKLFLLWKERTAFHAKRKFVQYVFIFENRGEIVGVTLHHPHGQLYAFPFIPPVVEKELDAGKKFFKKNKKCLHCEIIRKEKKFKKRVVCENEKAIAFVPFYARWPYEIHMYPKEHKENLPACGENDFSCFAPLLKEVIQRYDGLYGKPFPYMMVMHQSPVDGKSYPHYHFHIEFYTPQRAKDKVKFLAGVESGAGTFINDACAEEKAEELRNVKIG